VQTFVEAQVSSRHEGAKRGWETVQEQVHPGDLLLVSELARLGRSVGQIRQLVDRLLKQRVRLVAIKEHMRRNGTQALQTKVMSTMFGLVAASERDRIAARTKEDLAAARAKGRRPGRPQGVLGRSKLTGREAEMHSRLATTVSQASMAKMLGGSRSTLHHFIQSRRLA